MSAPVRRRRWSTWSTCRWPCCRGSGAAGGRAAVGGQHRRPSAGAAGGDRGGVAAGTPPPAPDRLNWHDRQRSSPPGSSRVVELACVPAAPCAGFGRGRTAATWQVALERRDPPAVVGMDLPHPGAGQWLHAALAAADPGQLSAVPAALRQGDAGATAPWVALCAGHDRAGAGTAALVPLGLELLRVRLRDDPHERAQQLVGVPAAADRAEPAVLWHRVVLRLSVAGHGALSQQRDVALQLSQDEVRRLATTAERERIGRDLHDLLGHTLSLITLKLELARKLHDRGDARARQEIGEAEAIAREALAQVRSAVTGIRASDLAGAPAVHDAATDAGGRGTWTGSGAARSSHQYRAPCAGDPGAGGFHA
ncbi:hypothetical protein G6F22_013569 [Rhizopus arrhizus]|nr:hypothetical protein G6F22_013569 [Rhizopus arrhizus]